MEVSASIGWRGFERYEILHIKFKKNAENFLIYGRCHKNKSLQHKSIPFMSSATYPCRNYQLRRLKLSEESFKFFQNDFHLIR